MNVNLTAKYLQFLRKSHNYTQEELVKRLDILEEIQEQIVSMININEHG